MGSRNLPVGEIYHIYNRGVDKRVIFLDEGDYDRFLALLYLGNSDKALTVSDIPRNERYSWDRGNSIAQIGAFCLMPNHFHIIMRQSVERGIEKMMQKIITAYTMYFNAKYERKGRLLESAYKAKHVSSDEQLRYLLAYVHLNPLSLIEPAWKVGGIQEPENAVLALQDTKVTSLRLLAHDNNPRPEKNILDVAEFPEYFMIPGDGRETLLDWVGMHAMLSTDKV